MTVEDQLAELTERVRRLEEQQPVPGRDRPTDEPPPEGSDDGSGDGSDDGAGTFWVLRGLRERVGRTGAVVWAGSVETTDGPVQYQYGRAVAELGALGPAELERAAEQLAALGSAVRLQILVAVLTGRTSTSALGDLPDVGTTGQVYHHVRALTAAGWLRSVGRGVVQVPPERVVAAWVAVSLTQSG